MAVAKTKPCDMEDMAKQNLKEDRERKIRAQGSSCFWVRREVNKEDYYIERGRGVQQIIKENGKKKGCGSC